MAAKKKLTSKKASKTKPKTSRSVKKSPKTEPKTMEELLASAKSAVAALTRGDKVSGIITEITKKSASIDIGGKSEGLVAEKAFVEAKSLIKKLKVGDKVEASVIIPETPEGYVILSLREYAKQSAWSKLERAYKKGSIINVVGISANPSGVSVEFQGLSGFVPASLLGKDYSKNSQQLIGRSFEVKIVDFNKKENKMIFSEREVSEAEDIEMVRKAIKKIKIGNVYDGEVTKVYHFGCFVKIRVGSRTGEKVSVEGLAHISELSWQRVTDPGDTVRTGDKVKVKAIEVKDGKISLSIKQAQKDPWDDAEKKYKKDEKVKGKVVKSSGYGIFVQLEPGVEGLVHITKIPPGKKLSKGDEVNVYVEKIDSKGKKLSLGLVLTTKPVGYK